MKGDLLGYSARIVADSVSPLGHRLTTFEICFPRLVLAEFNTHRVFSRNSASSRAIPVTKQLQKIMEEPFVPERFGINQSGMQSILFHEGEKHEEAVRIWLRGRDRAVLTAFELMLGEDLFFRVFGDGYPPAKILAKHFDRGLELLSPKYREVYVHGIELLNVHKQLANRVLEPYMWHTVIVTATEWSNYFALRVDKEAQPEIRRVSELMLECYDSGKPDELDYDEWHLPFIRFEDVADCGGDLSDPRLRQASAGKCARVSYLTHDGIRDLSKDIELHDRLSQNGHMSPLEHPARPMTQEEFEENPWSGNFFGWHQYRKDIPFESDFGKVKPESEGVA